LHPRNLLQAILAKSSLSAVRRELRKESGVLLSPEEIVSGVRRLLNETALAELENVRISLPERKHPSKRRKAKMATNGNAKESVDGIELATDQTASTDEQDINAPE